MTGVARVDDDERFAALGSALLLFVLAVVAAVALGGWGWIVVAAVFAAIALVGIGDLVQRRHSILRNYPILGHARFALEAVRPELAAVLHRAQHRRPSVRP